MTFDLAFDLQGQMRRFNLQDQMTRYRISSRSYVSTCTKMFSNDKPASLTSLRNHDLWHDIWSSRSIQCQRRGYRISSPNYVNMIFQNGLKRQLADMVTTKMIWFNSDSGCWFDSAHDSQWLYKTWFKSAHDSKWISEIWFKSAHDSKPSRIFWFKSTQD